MKDEVFELDRDGALRLVSVKRKDGKPVAYVNGQPVTEIEITDRTWFALRLFRPRSITFTRKLPN